MLRMTEEKLFNDPTKAISHGRVQKLFVVGGADPNHAHTETMNVIAGKWEIEQDYPYHESIFNSPVVYYDKSFIVFGGKCESDSVGTIALFDTDKEKVPTVE